MMTSREYLLDLAERCARSDSLLFHENDAERLRDLARLVPRTEQDVVIELVRELIALGYKISVDNGGEDFEITDSDVLDNVTAEMFATDQDTLYVKKDGLRGATIVLIYGNDPGEVIADYTARDDIEAIVRRVTDGL